MKTRSSSLTKLLSLLLTVITICSICTSCATGDITEFGPNFASDSGFASDLAPNNTNGSIPLFANGAYMAKVIHDGTPLGKSICEKLTKLISDYTGVPLTSEDSYAQTAAPAILIGKTTYPESKKAYETIGNDRATATVSGNKYVIAFSSEEAGENLLNTFKNLLNTKATKLQITIDKKWNISTAPAANQGTNNNNSTNNGSSNNGNSSENETTTPLETFDESTLNASGTLPTLGTSYNAGQSSKTYIMKDATKDKYTTLCNDIEKGGFKKYTSNSIGNNLFTTYLTKAQIVHVMFFPNKNQIRTAVDKRGTGTSGFALAGLSGDNKYQKTTESKMILCDISNADWPGGMCLIFKLADGRFFIVDAGIGGYISDGRSSKGSSSGWIYATLAKHAADPKNIQVAAWLITHVHSDHAGGLYDMALGYYGYEGKKHTVMPKEMKQYIKIDKLIYNQPETTKFGRNDWMSTIIKAFNVKNVVKAHPGQVFYAADLKLTIYGAQDLMLEKSGSSGDLNDFSIVSRAEFNGKSMLIMGDSDTIPNPVIAAIYKESLKSDILQMSHHGYGDTGDHEVNSYCNPEMTIWPVAKKDQRTDYNVNVKIDMASSLTTLGNLRNKNTSKGTATATLSNGKNYRPGMGNLIFDKNWSTTTTSRSEIMSAIPKCDGTHCGNKSCSKKSSSNLYVE